MATHGGGAFMNGSKIAVGHTKRMSDAIIGFGDFAVGVGAQDRNRVRLAALTELSGKALRVRMHGSAATDLAWVANGRLDASLTLSNKVWDIAAGVLLVREAGGRVYDLDGSEHSLRSVFTLASGFHLAASIMELLNLALGV